MVDAVEEHEPIGTDSMKLPESATSEPIDSLSVQVAEIKKNRPHADIIQNGTKVCIISSGDRYSFGTVAPDRLVRINNRKVDMGSLIGHPFGSSFQIDSCGFTRVQRAGQADMASAISEGRNNSQIKDDNNSQKLSSSDIEAMRTEGKGGEEIVNALVANSSTFTVKTEFSQEKYKAKKAKKYNPFCMVLCPTAATVCEGQFLINPKEIWNLRPDALATLLNLANISAYKRVLVVDSCMGLLTGAVAERMGLLGLVCLGFLGCQSPQLDVFKKFQLGREHNVVKIPLLELKNLVVCGSTVEFEGCSSPYTHLIPSIYQETRLEPDELIGQSLGELVVSSLTGLGIQADETPHSQCLLGTGINTGQEDVDDQDARLKQYRETAKDFVIPPAHPELLKKELKGGFDSCILVAPQFHPGSLIQAVLPLLAPGAPFAIYSPDIGPLAECHNKLFTQRAATLLSIQETWWREYQVLPGRTHPMMDGKNASGFILSGYKVLHKPLPEDVVAAQRRTPRGGSGKSWKRRR